MCATECGHPGADWAGARGVEAGTAGAGRGGRVEGRGGPEGQGTPPRQAQRQAPAPTPSPTSTIGTPSRVGRQEVGGGGPGGGPGGGGSAGGAQRALGFPRSLQGGQSQGTGQGVPMGDQTSRPAGGGDAERVRMAEDTLRRAKAKVAEKEEAIEALDRSVRWMEKESWLRRWRR